MNILKYYRLTRKWACKTYGLTDADLELLIYLDHKGRFTRNEFIEGAYTYSWGVDGDVVMSFDAPSGETTITISTADEFQAIKDIAEAIGGPVHSDGVIVIADDVAGTYVSSQMTGIDSIA